MISRGEHRRSFRLRALKRRAAVIALASGCCSLNACQLDTMGVGLFEPPGDAAVVDGASPDGAADASADASVDVLGDASGDTEPEVGDGASDAPADGLSDAPSDAPLDGPSEADAPLDGPSEADAPLDGPDEADAPLDGPDEADAPLDGPDEADAPVALAGSALSFSSSDNSYVEVGDLQVPQNFTIEAWIFPISTPGETNILAKDTSNQSASQFRLGLTNGNQLFFIMSDAGGDDVGLWSGGYALISPDEIPMGVWSHVAVVKEVVTFRLLVDGVVVSSVNATSDPIHAGTQPMRIAARQTSNGAPNGSFDGLIDEVRIFSTPRSAADIAADRSTPLSTSSTWWSSLIAYWRFDDGAGTTATDARGSHPGTLVNDPVWIDSDAF